MVKRLSSFFFSLMVISLLAISVLADDPSSNPTEIVEQQPTEVVVVEQQAEVEQEQQEKVEEAEVQQTEKVEQEEWQLLSTATTQAKANTNRDINISIASSYINEKILQPGEQFSFWDTVGKCTYAKGYKDATVYANGKKTTGIGGGVCQVSTTVNIAAKNAGIATKAKQHSLPVSYASREDEATVSYGNKDFKFTNTTGKVIKLVMRSEKGACTCEIWVQNNLNEQ